VETSGKTSKGSAHDKLLTGAKINEHGNSRGWGELKKRAYLVGPHLEVGQKKRNGPVGTN